MSQHYLVKLTRGAMPLSYYRKKLQNLFHLNWHIQIHQIWIHSITECWEYCKRMRLKYTSLIWTNWNKRLRMERTMVDYAVTVRAATMIGPDQWCIVCTPSLTKFPHTVIKWIQILQIWKPQFCWGRINFGVTFSDNSVVAHGVRDEQFKFHKVA